MSRRLALCLLAICMSATVAWGQNVVKIPFQYVADRGVFVENEFIVVLNEQARANVVATRGPSGEPRLNETSLQRLVERHGVARFERQFPTARAQRAGMNRVDLTGHYKVKLLPGQSLELATRGFAVDPNVDHVERIGVHPVYATPNDPFYQGSPDPFFPYDQWHLWNNYSIAADQAWNTETGNGDVLVGIIDSGLRYFHADIGGNVAPWGPDNPHTGGNVFVNGNEIPGNGIDDDGNGFIDDTVGWDFVTEGLNDLFVFCFDQDCEGADNNPDDGEGHGTHVAGTVAAITNNDILCAGVAGGFGDGTQSSVGNGAKVIPLRIGYRAYYYGYFVGIVRMDWAAEAMVYTAGLVDAGHNVAAVNCSWGSSDSGGLAAAVDYLLSRDVMIVHAAGNSGDSTPDFLATLPRVMNVAATDASGRAATFTSFGSWVHVAAPGVDVVSTWTNPDDFDINNHYVSVLSGTSMAAPHVCGIAALLEAAKPSLTAQAKFDLIVNNVSPYKGRANIGSGIANARLALDAALAGDPPSCDIVAGFSAVPTTGTVPLAVAFTDESTNASSWLWDFGDGTVSTMQNPTHTYTEPGIYSVTQSVTSNCGSAERTQTDYITVNEQTGGGIATKMFVSDIRLAREDLGKGRKRCVATVTIRDDRGGALPDATVTGGFTGKTNDGGLSSTSDLDGKAVFISGEAKGGRGEWCFTVTSVSHPTLVYDPSLNVATQMCESSGTLASHFAGPDAPSITWASPNPFNPETRIHFVLPEAASVELVVYDVRGRVVRRLVADRYPAGSHSVGFDARNDAGRALPSGVYFYRLTGPGGTETRKLMLLK